MSLADLIQTDWQDNIKFLPSPGGHQTRREQQKETDLFGPREVYCAFSLDDKQLKKATRTKMQQNEDLYMAINFSKITNAW